MTLFARRVDTSVALPISHCWKEEMLHTGLAFIQDESESTELVGCRSTSHVSGLGICPVG